MMRLFYPPPPGCYHFDTNCLVKLIYRGLISQREPASIGVYRKLDTRMAELALYVGGALTLPQQEPREAVPQGVRGEVQWKPGGF